MRDQTQAYDIFQTPLSSGYPLPLSSEIVQGFDKIEIFLYHKKLSVSVKMEQICTYSMAKGGKNMEAGGK
jgi:hypothetical protein